MKNFVILLLAMSMMIVVGIVFLIVIDVIYDTLIRRGVDKYIVSIICAVIYILVTTIFVWYIFT